MRKPLVLTCSGPYIQTNEGLDRAKELSREELRKLLDSMGEDGTLDSTSSGDVSGPAAQSAQSEG